MNKNYAFLFLLICVACNNGKTPTAQINQQEIITKDEGNLALVKDSMDLYLSGYQNWTENNEIYDTLSDIKIYWNTNFLIIEESEIERTFAIVAKISEEKSELPKEHGGMLLRTVYKLENNDTDYDELVVFRSEFVKRAYEYEYTVNFTLSGKGFAKSYYSNKGQME